MAERAVDKGYLLFVPIVQHLLSYGRRQVNKKLENRIRTHYSRYTCTFEAYARLDVPSFNDPVNRQQLEEIAQKRMSIAWKSLEILTELFSTAVLLLSQAYVLFSVLREHKDGLSTIIVCCFPQIMLYACSRDFYDFKGTYKYISTRLILVQELTVER